MGGSCDLQSGSQQDSGLLTLGTSGSRDITQSIRYLLEHIGLQHKELPFTSGQWLGNSKKLVGLQFPKLPFLLDNRVQLTCVLTILKFIVMTSSKKPLLGRSDNEKILVEQALALAEDLSFRLESLHIYAKSPQRLEDTLAHFRAEILLDLQPVLLFLEGQLAKNEFFPIEDISLADFVMFELAAEAMHELPQHRQDKVLREYSARVRKALPLVDNFLRSERCLQGIFERKKPQVEQL